MFLKFENICQSPTSTQHNLNCRWALDENDFSHHHHPTPPTIQELYYRSGEIKGSVNPILDNYMWLFQTILDYVTQQS